MNATNAYRRSMVTAPGHTLVAKLHEQAGVFTENALRFTGEGDTASARKHITYVQDIISFLRASLDMSLEASRAVDSVYAFYYDILIKWYVNITDIPQETQVMLEFWSTWAQTWTRVGREGMSK